MTISIPTIPDGSLVPGVAVQLVLGAGEGFGSPYGKLLLVGQGIDTALTYITGVPESGAATTGTIAAGAGLHHIAQRVDDPKQAAEFAGYGSELHCMALAAAAHNESLELWLGRVLPTTDSPPDSATATLVFKGSTNAAGTGVDGATGLGQIRVRVNGKTYAVTITTGMSTRAILNQLCLVLADPEAPFYVSAVGLTSVDGGAIGTVTAGNFFLKLTSKIAGSRGNATEIVVETVSDSGVVYYTSGSAAVDGGDSLVGVTGVVSVAGVMVGLYKTVTADTTPSDRDLIALTNGSRFDGGADGSGEATNITTLLANTRSVRFPRIALPYTAKIGSTGATTIIGMFTDQIENKASPYEALYEQAIICNPSATHVDAANEAIAINNPNVQCVWFRNSSKLPGEVAAAVAAARLGGDDGWGGKVKGGEIADANTNLCGLVIQFPPAYGATQPPAVADMQYALLRGVTPLAPSRIPGYVEVVRSITTYCRDSAGRPTTSCLDTNNVTTPQELTLRMKADYIEKFSNAYLIPENTPANQLNQKTVKASDIEQWAKTWLAGRGQEGFLIDVAELSRQVKFEISKSNRTRVSGKLRMRPTPWLVTSGILVEAV